MNFMIERIVRMSFRDESVKDFIRVFDVSKNAIASFKGCRGLKLLRDIKHKNVYFTYGLWDDESALESYRNSPLFETTWAQTKALFDHKPMAWSTHVAEVVK